MLDEPSEGIMPVLVDEMFELFARMKQQGTTILLVEQNVERALDRRSRLHPRPGRDRPPGAAASCWPTRRSRSAIARCEAREIPRGCAGKAVALSKSGFLVIP